MIEVKDKLGKHDCRLTVGPLLMCVLDPSSASECCMNESLNA